MRREAEKYNGRVDHTCRADSCSSSGMLCNAEIQPWKGQQMAAETRVPGKTSSPHLSHDFFKLLDDNSSPLGDSGMTTWPGPLLPHHNFRKEF